MIHFVDFLKILGQLNFLFHGLVLEIWKNSKIFMGKENLVTIKSIFEFFLVVPGYSIFHTMQ